MGQSDDVFEAVGGVARESLPFATSTQILAMRTSQVDVPSLLFTAATRLRTCLENMS